MTDPPVITSKALADAVDLFIQGHSTPSILEHIANNTPEDPAEIIASARAYFSAVGMAEAMDPTATIGMVKEAFLDIYRQSMAVGDLATARQCLRDIRDTTIKLSEFDFEEAT